MLLFEKIAVTKEELDAQEKQLADLQKQINKNRAEVAKAEQEAAALKANTLTFPDGTTVDKRTYPPHYFDNISVGEKPLPTDAYSYINPHNYDEVYHNALMRARKQKAPKGLLDRLFDRRHKQEMRELDDKIFNTGRVTARESHLHRMNRGYGSLAREAQAHAKMMHLGKLQALGILGAGGIIGGGALLASNRNAPVPMPISNPMRYEQDYYH